MTNPWDAAHADLEERYGPLDLARSEAEARVREHLVRRLEPLGLAPLEASLDDLLERSAGGDLMLAVAVEAGLPGAAGRLRERLTPRLLELARKRGVVSGLAQRYVSEVLDKALTPDAVQGTRPLAAYDGTSTLTAWLAIDLEERLLKDARQPAPGEPEPPPEPPVNPKEHPNANLLAGLAQGRLLDAEAHLVGEHAQGCPRCAGLLRGLGLAGVHPPGMGPEATPAVVVGPRIGTRPGLHLAPRRSGPKRPARLWGGLLLGVLVTVGIVLLAAAQSGPGLFSRLGLGQDTEHEVFEATRMLHRTEPGMFGEFEPFTRLDLESGTARPSLEAEGPRPIHPRERVLSGSPTFQWKAVPDATRYTLTILDEQEVTLWSGTVAATSQAWPPGLTPLGPGTPAAWEVSVEGAPEQPLRTRFSTAPERDLVHWDRRTKRLAELVPEPGVRAVLTAQIALRRGHLWEAWEAIRAHTRGVPRDGYGEALEGYIRRLHGFHD